ncbi:uncharacterized protein LOC110436809 [Sorghum bicolor]|uniref:Disease resistance protein At4g27190-like leucine-rich repeats domain-containing protein n=1 Tax=Sorghum bicolor TaxID=4558 RepID=A0A1B6PFH9_SORBI|nr:uncharacterized protein LOC110436809 [Sorghum bicolor]XP_021319996.1 uncharacterized protein LOC110436809 [Sorghum bicolor]KXG24440.1 hypothetical protein SORBI_3007G042100 [Sorghum bicolor]KXG24441.1 hypothetical protein SORBI_3007G042100 [Sorghum bicolor]KXG24442.1 hypothetical protein SORBI_3007G042100 [Sorghum bicolor]KXG24443.2 hypothetical protein SORBI_3007G042100 [Sorghum bicolor]|eukprot:XP_021319995.1 uncharacterized protein LOC110436809 [Sorghum bicolor]
MPPENFKWITAYDIRTAVQQIVPYLEDTSNNAPRVIYFEGWYGLAASAVLRAIAEHPPQSLREKFDKIIHIDCSMWKSRRALQRVITEELKLTQQVAAIDMKDKEDDFSGVDQGSRAEVEDVTTVIARYLVQSRSLVVFHNGSEDVVDLTDIGIPALKFLGTKVLWTFRGRLRLNDKIYIKVDASHLFLYAEHGMNWNAHLAEEAREISLYTHKLGIGVTPKIVTECCLYLLSLNNQCNKMIDYNWGTHASCYWVCDGIIGGGRQDNRTWEVAHALQQHIRLEDYSSNAQLMSIVEDRLDLSSNQWISITESYFKEIPPETTTLFFSSDKSSPQVVSLPSDKFHKADQLRVLKLCGCTFSFSSPPFHCCRNLRFLGLDRCKDELQQGEEEEKTDEPAVEIFQRLWVLDVCHTDWPLAFPPETEEQVVTTNIREVHITNGRIWHSNFAWKRLPNIHKLRVVEPTNPWETYQGLPSSLESFSLDAGRGHENKAIISCISLAGCTVLSDFILRGSLPNLEELDLSYTAVKILDLREVVQVKNLQRLFLMGCDQLRSISWPKTRMYKLRLMCIDTRAGGGEVDNRKLWSRDCSLMVYQQDEVKEYCHASIAVADMRFLQSLKFLWTSETIQCDKWYLCLSSTSNDDGRVWHKDKMGHSYSTGQLAVAAPSLPNSLTYHDISIEQISAKIDSSSSSSTQFIPLDLHMEIAEGISDVTDKSSTWARDAIRHVMNNVQSLHVHDSSSITSVAPEHTFETSMMNGLKRCCVERCPKLDTVFATTYFWTCFSQLEIFWAAHLLMARFIWSRPRDPSSLDPNDLSFTQLRAIHLHFCPRLRYVLPMASNNTLSKVLETLHIHCCGDLRQVFLMEKEFLETISSARHEKGKLEFSNLKSLYLYELQNLQQICEAKLFAPKLETIYIRGCWGLRRLPATADRPVAVDCEKDWWDKLEWDGMESGHHPSLFEPSHSKYYKRRHLRTTVLR